MGGRACAHRNSYFRPGEYRISCQAGISWVISQDIFLRGSMAKGNALERVVLLNDVENRLAGLYGDTGIHHLKRWGREAVRIHH